MNMCHKIDESRINEYASTALRKAKLCMMHGQSGSRVMHDVCENLGRNYLKADIIQSLALARPERDRQSEGEWCTGPETGLTSMSRSVAWFTSVTETRVSSCPSAVSHISQSTCTPDV
eukprot:COSAG05_NODE_2495_length_2983_cov_12.675535_4_plen_118_part_00